jgi:hypothetical protein
MSTSLQATLMIGPDAAAAAEATVHAAGYRDDLIIGAIRVADLCIQSNYQTGPDDLAAFLDALAAKVRDAHVAFLARQSDPEEVSS